MVKLSAHLGYPPKQPDHLGRDPGARQIEYGGALVISASRGVAGGRGGQTRR